MEGVPDQITMSQFRAALRAWPIMLMFTVAAYAIGTYKATNQDGVDALAKEIHVQNEGLAQLHKDVSSQGATISSLTLQLGRDEQSILDLREDLRDLKAARR